MICPLPSGPLDQILEQARWFILSKEEFTLPHFRILAGLFIYALWILTLGNGRSGLAAALALSVMMLPYIIRAADLALRLVPANLREAAMWRSVICLPRVRSRSRVGLVQERR